MPHSLLSSSSPINHANFLCKLKDHSHLEVSCLSLTTYEETAAPSLSPPCTPPPPTVEDVKLTEAGNDRADQACYSVALVTAVAAVAAAQAAAEVVRLTCDRPGPTKGEEEHPGEKEQKKRAKRMKKDQLASLI
ncbi:hypothetical protein OIU85_001119 [Salix viminalis]|uniref:Uncharacterized protein n=1 Tax=Salix viminalis TaxID=40686 RepID=A0A9Q0VLN8_SALVM|nr:hypothetical protein OIU85_001119 [Salix viminalis]